MNLVQRNTMPQGLAAVAEPSKPGFFQKLLSKVVDAALNWVGNRVSDATFGLVSSNDVKSWIVQSIDSISKNFVSDTFLYKQAAPVDITDAEADIIKKWYDDKFQPEIAKMLDQVKYAQNLTTISAKLTTYNAVLNEINIIQSHFEEIGEPGLSQNALDQRNYLIYVLLKPVNDAIQAMVLNLGVKTTTTIVQVATSNYDLKPLITNPAVATVESQIYVLGGKQAVPQYQTGGNDNPGPSATGQPVKSGNVPILDLSGVIIPDKSGTVKGQVQTATGTQVQTAVPAGTTAQPQGNTPATTTTDTTANKSTGKKLLIGVAGLAIVYVVVKAASKN